MKKLLVASASLMLMCAPALAHTTRHHHNTKTITNSAHKGSMSTGTTGMGHGMQKNGMRPDASGQGGSGPGSDQGGTRVAPGAMK